MTGDTQEATKDLTETQPAPRLSPCWPQPHAGPATAQSRSRKSTEKDRASAAAHPAAAITALRWLNPPLRRQHLSLADATGRGEARTWACAPGTTRTPQPGSHQGQWEMRGRSPAGGLRVTARHRLPALRRRGGADAATVHAHTSSNACHVAGTREETGWD